MSRGGSRLHAGRPRKTAAQHALQGTVQARPNPNEPKYAIEAPEKPDYIAANVIASNEWNRVMPLLLEQRVITRAFRASLEGYCTSYADVVVGETLKARPEFTPFVADGPDQKLKAHPVIKQVLDAKRELRSWAAVLGLLPTTVGRVSSAPMPEAQDEEDGILAKLEQRTSGSVVAFKGR